MKTKKTLGVLAMALTALSCAFPSTAKAAGDIRSIEVYQDAETTERTYPNANAPLVAGETVKFKIRLLNRGTDVATMTANPDFRNPWTMQHVGGNDPIADTNNMPQVGLWISGQRKYAKIESLKLADQYFTEMICSYKVQAGDLAMPLKLVRPDGKGEAMEVSAGNSWYSEDYFMKNSDLWNFFPNANGGNTSSNKVEFYFGPTTLGSDTYAQVRTADLAYGSNRDYNLANAGIFIQAVDFDSQTTDDGEYWRSVAAGSTTAVPALPRLSIPGGCAESQTLYVWTKDSTVAVVDNDGDQDYVFGDGKTRRVSKITVKPGDEVVPFRVRGVKEGFSTEVYMAATPTNVYNNAGSLVTNFTTRTIWVSEALPPGMTVEINPDAVKTSSNYKLSVASINVQLTQAYTEDLTVTLKPVMADGSGVDPFTYIGLSSLSDGKEEYSKKELTLKITKGSTSATESLLYLYANRADEHTLKGIRFEVDQTALPAAAQAFFTGAFSSDTIEIDYDGGALEVLSPLEGTKYEHVPGNVETPFAITITDAIGELNDGTYTVYWDNNGSGTYTEVSGLKADAKGVINVPRRYVTAMTYNSQFYVMNEGGAKSAVRHVVVSVDAPKTVTATLDLGVANYKEGDTAKVTLDFSDTFQESSNPGYIFIKPLDETTASLVDIQSQNDANHTTQVLVYPGFATANSQATIKLKDGYNGATLSFGIEVREANDDTQDNVISAWVGKQFFIGVTNVVPKISYISMNDTPVSTDGGTFSTKVPIGVQKTFSIGVSDPAIDADFADGNKAYTILKFWENGAVTDSKLIKGVPAGQSVTYTFMNAGTARVTAKVRDKDMTDQEFDEAPEFSVNVLIIEAPAITLEPLNGSNIFNETDTGVVNGRINVNLTVAPQGLDVSEAINVVLEVSRNGLNDGMMPVLSRYEIPFKNGQTTGNFYLSELDGTPQSELKGFRIRAYVKETTQCPVDTSKTWRQYYTAVDDFDIFIANVDPQIGPGAAVSTNERPASINVPFTITWNAKDVAPDQETMKVTWSYNGSSQTTTQSTTGTYSKEIMFTSAGSKIVTLTVEDKDGGTDTRSWYYKVEASMGLEITPRRPNTGAFSKFTQKYTGAMGIGAGRVWSTSADSPTRVSNFTQAWDFQPANDLNPKIYAYGYKVGDTDNGTLGPAGSRDYAVDAAGTWYNQANRYGSYYIYNNADGKDSFFYCWLLYDRDEGNSSHLNGTIQPQVGNGTGENAVQMPEYDEEAASYVRTMVEAIFAIEFYKEDNVGDINQDGIPDIYAAATTWNGGTLYEFAEGELEEGGDLRNVAALNTDEDYLPARTARGGVIVQTQQNWARLGGAFQAILEIRGFGTGLNFRQDNDGMNRNVRGNWISDPCFTPAESNAVARVNGLVLPDPASDDYAAQVAAWTAGLNQPNSWIPENRTDPTVEDTDSDGFPDGYEYWFWYSAMVGEMDANGNIHRLTGSRFTLNDIATGEVLTPEEIAAAFNPTVASNASYTERDTDNDGLTDMEEYALGTNPINWDTDGDGLSDYWEVMNGMNPVKTDPANNGTMNADGDFMAKYTTEADYAVVTIDGQEYALINNGNRYVVFDEELDTWSITDIGKTNFVAIKVYRYGKPGSEIVPMFRGGTVMNLPDYEGIEMAARPLDARVWQLPEDATITAGALDQSLMLVHDQVYAQNGFDPRTGWYSNANGMLAPSRWSRPAGQAINTAPYTARDEYLVLKYRYMQEPGFAKLDTATGGIVQYTIAGDTDLWNNNRQANVFQDGTTKPNVAFEDPDWITEAMGDTTYASDVHGADTDGDGVPDGWELYVGANPNVVPRADLDPNDADNDGLGLAAEFAGTDSCNAYEGCESIYANHPGNNSGWYNKFFPTDPADEDTDGDGIADAEEGARWLANWSYGKAAGQMALYSFIYGPNENRPAGDNPNSTCIRGGGLNPCSVDTDGDLLPDPWERNFAGLVFANGRAVVLQNNMNVVEADVLTVINRGDGVTAGDAEDGDGENTGAQYITAGMDGTNPNDAYGSVYDVVTGTTRDMDFDHDGLQNFQEYLVQAVRQFRYDDSETPLMGSWMPDGPANSRKFVSFLPMNIMDGDTFYAQCKAAGFAATGAWQFRELGYFARPPKEWDPIAVAQETAGAVNYDEYGYRIMLPPQGLLADGSRATAGAYCSTDPRLWDTDGDGMDDYYEMFHGLNPLLGSVQDNTIANDVIALAYGGQISHWNNGWTAWPEGPWTNNDGEPLFDVMAYPWMMGTPEADADGDGLRNINEALLVNMTSPMPTHTDPTPLWYTDSSALNDSSFTRQYYQLDSFVLAQGGTPDFAVYPWSWLQGRAMTLEGSTSGTFMFSFEENEGYDTDNDRVPDAEERTMTASSVSDPLNFTDPDRRQALWFPGNESAAVSYSGYFHRPNGDQYDVLRQFTVEAWICPEDLTRDQVILERVAKYTSSTLSNHVGQVRANFRIGLLADGRLYGCFDTSDAVPTGTGIGTPTVIGTVPVEGKWVHVALTYNGVELKLHQDGHVTGVTQTSLEPANGIMVYAQEALPGMTNFPVLENGYTTLPCAFLLGARALDDTAIGLSADTTWESYADYYAGYIDEVRVWDGCRTLDEIKATYKKRLRFADVAAQRYEVYDAWMQGMTRNDNDGKGNLPAELLQHYSFQTLPGAVNATDVMWEPTGFTKNVFDNVRDMDGVLPAGTFECGWWSQLPVHSTVYENYTWVPWIQNTCGHLPIMDGSTPDSRYWSEYFGGATMAKEVYNSQTGDLTLADIIAQGDTKKILFNNAAVPYSLYNYSSEKGYHENFLAYMAQADASCQTNVNLYAFEIRSGFVGTSDLLPLGGAFAKRNETMWDGDGSADAWEITADGDSAFSDVDANGIPDWWQELAMAEYGAAEGFDWGALVTWEGIEMTAREAYLRDLARGMLPGGLIEGDAFVSKRDDDKDGLPDWWESLKGVSAENAYADHDNDQLSNYAEYLISEGFSKYGFPRIDPVKPNTFGDDVTDYFLRQGSLYLGEMFADHDFMSDAWEDKYDVSVVSRGQWDALKDADDDGWSNWAEYQAGTRPDVEASLTVDGATFAEYPVPVVSASIRYNGKKSFSAPIVIQAWAQENTSDKTMGGLPDAAWSVPTSGDAAQKEKVLGLNKGRQLTYCLGPGSVVVGSVTVQFMDLNYQLLTVGDDGSVGFAPGTPANATWLDTLFDNARTDGSGMGDIILKNGMGQTSIVGEIDYTKGLITIDFGAKMLQDYAVTQGEEDNDENAMQVLNLSASYAKVLWTSQKVDAGNGATFYLGESISTAAAAGDDNEDTAQILTRYGHLREGKNLFVAYADLDNSGSWTPGEPYGIAANVQVGWSSASLSIELTDTAPQMARLDISGLTQATDFAAADVLSDRSASINGTYYKNLSIYDAFNYLPPEGDDQGGEVTDEEGLPAATATTRVRIIRTAVNGELSVNGRTYNETVLDREIYLGGHPMLSEADLVADGLLDLDWGTLEEAWGRTHNSSAIMTDLTNVTYRVVYGNGAESEWDFNSYAKVAFVNAFERGREQTLCEPVSPKGTVSGTTTTFQWKHAALDQNGYKIKDYPAFRLQVLDAAGDVVYDSGNQPAPARNALGVYSWTAPLYAGMVTESGKVFSAKENYTWQVSMLDAKFTEPNWAAQAFRLEATGMMQDGRRYGTVAANIRYYGPLAEMVSVDPAEVRNMIHVQAFTSPDFAGTPVAEGYVTDASALTSKSLEGVNTVMLALPAGTYYIAAYIDSNGNFQRDDWETWGYACGVGGSNTEVWVPKAVTVVEPSSTVPSVNIFLEDADKDNDGFPDAWEFVTFGSLDQQSSVAGDTAFTKVNTELVYSTALGSFADLGLTELATGSDYKFPTLMGVILGETSSSAIAAALLEGLDVKVLEPTTTVKIDAFAGDTFKVAVTSEAKPVESKLLAVEPEAVISYDLVLASAKTLDGAWTETKIETITVKVNATTDVTSAKLAEAVKAQTADGAAFFKVKLIEK